MSLGCNIRRSCSSATTTSCGSTTRSALYEALPAGRLCVVPGASHAVVMERPGFVAAVIEEFLGGPEPPETLIPIRRRSR